MPSGRVTGVVRRIANPYGYIGIYLGWSWFFWGLIVLSGRSVWTFPNALLWAVGGLSPVVAGVGMIYWTSGRAGLRELLDRFLSPRRVTCRWYLVLVGLFPLLTLLAAGLAVLGGAPKQPPLDPGAVGERLSNPVGLLAFVGFTLGAGVVEETGSTGFFLDRLQTRWTPIAAGLISGTVWASWHVPLFLMEGYWTQAAYQPVVWRFFASFIFIETLFSWIYDHTDRSILAAVLFHMMANLTGEVLSPSPLVRWYSFALIIATAVLIALWQRRRVLLERL